jgi:hypothetical protein
MVGPEADRRLRLLRLAHLRPAYVAIACALWAGFVVALPQLTLLAFMLSVRARAWLSPASDYGVAFGGAHWASSRAMVLSAVIPPAVLLVAWTVARLTHRGAAP